MKCLTLTSLALAAFLGLVLGLTTAPARQAADAATAPVAAAREQIQHWITQLGDDDFDTREAAASALQGHEEARPFLRKALSSPDTEVSKRAASILAALDRKQASRELDKALDFGKDGRVDEVVERLVRWQGSEKGRRGWKAVYELASAAARIVDRKFAKDGCPNITGMPLAGSAYDILVGQPTEVSSPRMLDPRIVRYLIRDEAVDWDKVFPNAGSIVAATRSVRLTAALGWSVIVVSGGPVEVSTIEDSLVICDGDFTAKARLLNCIIVARGKATCPHSTTRSFISARKVEFPHGCDGKNVIRTGDAVPLGFIHWFDPAEAGVETSPADDVKGVLVKSVAKDKPFAAAGVQAGDVIAAVGEEKIDAGAKPADQFEAFRRALRKALAADEAFTLTVRRDDKTLELTVHPAD